MDGLAFASRGTLVGTFVALCGVAAPQARDHESSAAFLFAYRPKPGMEAEFAAGYRRHLDWHAAHGDSLAWLAWTIADGPNSGVFVDGTFGVSFEAFDDRVDPAGDGADAERNVTAYADPLWREVYTLRRDLSSSARLEERTPLPLQRVVRVSVHPQSEATFEAAIRESVAAYKGASLSVYRQVSGGRHGSYLLIVQLSSWRSLGDAGADVVDAMLRRTASAIESASTEMWRFRPDLTYVPGRERVD